MTASTLVIGLDGADSNLVDRWSQDGTLPNLAKLRARGSAHHLDAPHGVTDDALWASFQYGVGIGEHGRFNYIQRLSDGRIGMSFLDEADRERFWDRLSNAGQRVAIIDVPKTGVPRPLNGIHLADWLVHGRYFKRPHSYPEELATEVLEKFGAAPPSRCNYHVDLDEAVRRDLAGNLLRATELKEAAGLHYLSREHWDLFVIGFKESHCAGHNFWDLIDPNHPDYDVALCERLGDPLRAIFKRVDDAVGRLIEAAGPDAKVIVFTTTKMEPNASLKHFDPRFERHLNRALAENPLAQYLRRRRKEPAPIEVMPYNENGTAIRINRKGAKRERLMHKVETLLARITDADTGELLMDRIYHPSADYTGSRTAQLPDLLVRYRAGHVPARIKAPGLHLETSPPTYRTGNHACGPFVMAAGIDVSCVRALEDFAGLVGA